MNIAIMPGFINEKVIDQAPTCTRDLTDPRRAKTAQHIIIKLIN